MSSQFVDIDGDGFKDILCGSFSGTPQWIRGTAKGLLEPAAVMNGDGETVLISAFWNDKDNKWDATKRAGSEGHCTSSSAVDWDGDGDLDLLLGDYYGGRLYFCLNEGSKTKPKFSASNQPVLAGGKPLVVPLGLASPCVVDWNKDGLFDILCGGTKGGVYYYQNEGKAKSPKFASAKKLIAPLRDTEPTGMAQSKNGKPTLPVDSFHIEAADYDGDGDLDLLIGAKSSWSTGKLKKLTAADEKRLAEIAEGLADIQSVFKEELSDGSDQEKVKKFLASEKFRELGGKQRALMLERQKIKPNPTKSGFFVWLYRRSG